MIATANKPSMPSNLEIAQEMGIKPATEGWKKLVAKARENSPMQKAWEKECADFEAAHPEIFTPIAAERKRYEDAGMSHLYGGRLHKSKNGSYGIEVSGNRAAALSAAECEFLGKIPGPANK